MKILIDTNVIIDALTSREPFKEAAEQIFLMAANQIEDMYITASSATDIYYLVKKYLHSTEQAKNVMAKLYELFYILDVISADCREALLSEVNDYEDAVLSCCAKRNHINYIITRNIKDYEKSKVQAILPDEFIGLVTGDN
ncbi:MAG: PIN domain-containing protein [Clostridium sp.]|nr:PIN domain-containing protein [Clostridium sp.]